MKVGVKKLLRAGMVPARTWGVRAVVIARTERLKIKETDGSSSGEKEHGLSVLVHELSTVATQYWAEGGLDGKMVS